MNEAVTLQLFNLNKKRIFLHIVKTAKPEALMSQHYSALEHN